MIIILKALKIMTVPLLLLLLLLLLLIKMNIMINIIIRRDEHVLPRVELA